MRGAAGLAIQADVSDVSQVQALVEQIEDYLVAWTSWSTARRVSKPRR